MKYNGQFCSIEEAWGESGTTKKDHHKKRSGGSSRKSSKSPEEVQPPCHLYDRKTSPEMEDIYSMFHDYDKIPFSRTQAASPYTQDVIDRNPPLASVDITPDVESYDATAAPAPIDDSRIQALVEARVREANKELIRRNAGLEFAAYVVSGMLLILILEQVIGIGMHMRPPF
jgi:hypothetical protein